MQQSSRVPSPPTQVRSCGVWSFFLEKRSCYTKYRCDLSVQGNSISVFGFCKFLSQYFTVELFQVFACPLRFTKESSNNSLLMYKIILKLCWILFYACMHILDVGDFFHFYLLRLENKKCVNLSEILWESESRFSAPWILTFGWSFVWETQIFWEGVFYCDPRPFLLVCLWRALWMIYNQKAKKDFSNYLSIALWIWHVKV